ncbi:hypothetical protein [Cytobacillus sp. NCCP-133]|uniref:hypothetical protein n=1 Tax=Cytobacillus sp. NCCP-133 TaxID=766848 RepID=UPI00222E5351|nr:hypothetical protein [Cytobacillus sp. NCCP-133]GLB59014.1 hypothetical protein NCCP133_11470 [Cytobacillus sp. NCCP-133]
MAFKDLTQGIKISISRSITTSFENYMSRIDWQEDKFNLHHFINEWREYINNHSSWYSKVNEETKTDAAFHEELAAKINEIINKILSEEPIKEQLEEIEQLQKQLGEEYDYSCKMEAKYVIEKLKAEIKKKQSS